MPLQSQHIYLFDYFSFISITETNNNSFSFS